MQKRQPTFTVAMALLVNSIVDFSSFCTSILKLSKNEIINVRNLDFDFPPEMQKLVYNQKFVRNGETIAIAPSVAGFYGVYTAVKPGYYSMSYNVRFTAPAEESYTACSDHAFVGLRSRSDDIWSNIEKELDPTFKPFQNYF